MESASIPVEALYEWTRQLVWHHPDEAVPHSFGGTGFMFTWQSRYVLATAGHCVRGRPGHPWVGAGLEDVIPFDGPWTFKGGDPLDSDACDLAVYLAAPDRLTARQKETVERVDLARFLRRSAHRGGESLVVPGFPTTLQGVDYDAGTVVSQGQALAAAYEGASDYRACHWLRFAEESRLATYDGYSGSPVLRWAPAPDQTLHVEVIGVLLRASSGRGLFVDSEVLVMFLSEIDAALSRLERRVVAP